MNYRRALRASTDTGLAVFLIVIVGVILWTTDEVLNWNILPDWIDRYAQVLVIVLSILAGFSVVISLMCSFAVLAESAAEKAGIASPTPSRRARLWLLAGLFLGFGILFGLHKLDQYRATQAQQVAQQEQLARYAEAQKELGSRMPNIIALFSPAIQEHLTAAGSDESDKAVGRLLNAIHTSTPFRPEVSVLVRAETPYQYCVITALPEPHQEQPGSTAHYLRRQFLTDLPSSWERDVIERMFRGEPLTVARENRGVFIDTEKPSAWGFVTSGGKVIAVMMLKATG
jgi:hypothetical protein